MTDQTLPPPVMWAQRAQHVLLTVNLGDVKDPDIKFTKNSVYFKGTGGPDKKTYEATIPLYKDINDQESKYANRGRCIEMVLVKAEDGPWWPSLTSGKEKLHWVKCDFNKWQDEDESGDEGVGGMGGGGGDFEEMMRRMGGLGGGGGGGAGGEYKPNFDDLDLGAEGEEDSDDEEIPGLE